METISSSLHVRPRDDPIMIGAPCSKRMKLTPINEIDDQKMLLKKTEFRKLLQEKKLSLVLDLDHTLLHSVVLNRLTPEDCVLLLNEAENPKKNVNRNMFPVNYMGELYFVTKLRPGLGRFLEEASKMYQLHIFTKGSREYASEVLKLIDPESHYFGCTSSSTTRVFSRENCVEKRKSLDLVIGKESGIVVIDDKEEVWRDVDKENVLEIPEYDFFKLKGGRKLSEILEDEEKDESETEGLLSEYLGLLKFLHAKFFDPKGAGDISERDVRVLKKKYIKEEDL